MQRGRGLQGHPDLASAAGETRNMSPGLCVCPLCGTDDMSAVLGGVGGRPRWCVQAPTHRGSAGPLAALSASVAQALRRHRGAGGLPARPAARLCVFLPLLLCSGLRAWVRSRCQSLYWSPVDFSSFHPASERGGLAGAQALHAGSAGSGSRASVSSKPSLGGVVLMQVLRRNVGFVAQLIRKAWCGYSPGLTWGAGILRLLQPATTAGWLSTLEAQSLR